MGYYQHASARGGFFDKVGKALGGIGKAVVRNSPIGQAYSTVKSVASAFKSPRKASINVQPSDFGTIKGGVVVPTRSDIAKGVISMTPIGGLINQYLPGVLNMGPQAQGGACPPGYHLDKATRSKCVRNRSMNFSNGRATGRAIRRLKGAEKSLKKVLRVMGKSVTRVGPKTGKRRSR